MDNDMKIAIIGYDGAFPGADSPEQLWQLSSQGKTGLNRLDMDLIGQYLPSKFYLQKGFCNVGGGPKDYKTFDARFFGYSPKEAMYLDPQIRKSLEFAWNSLENAGYAPNQISLPIGVYLASSVNTYFFENLIDDFETSNESERSHMLFLNECDFFSTRIAYHFNWNGPAFTVKCGCSSSLVALHLACQGLLNYDCDMALAGGVAIKSRYQYGYIYEKDSILSKDGRCSPFSNNSSGTIFANGIGMVVLKRLKEAINDGDTIHGIICATSINNDGQDKVGYMAPSVSGQKISMQTLLTCAGLTPGDIQYIETHGTGTELGDPIEFQGLLDVYKNCKKQSITLGAVKGNIGHLDAASGVAGLIKVLQDLKHKTISPIANFENPNPKIILNNSPFKINKTLTEWNSGINGRKAIISSFGMGGTNVHLALEEYQENKTQYIYNKKQLFVFSAKTEKQLQNQLEAFSKFFEKDQSYSLSDISYTLLIGRSQFNYRWSCIADNYQELCEKLADPQKEFVCIPLAGEVFSDETTFYDVLKLKKWWQNGLKIRLSLIKGLKRVSLPGYSFTKEEYWIERGYNNNKIFDTSRWFYLPTWKRKQIQSYEIELNNKIVLIFADNEKLSCSIHDKLKKQNVKVIFVYPFKTFKKDNDVFFLRPGVEEDFDLLIKDLIQNENFPDIVFHLWNYGNDGASFEQTQNKGLYSLVAFCKSSMKFYNLVPNFSIVCNGIANVSGNEKVCPDKATLIGISQVLPKEHEKAFCQLIDINPSLPIELNTRTILNELCTRKSCEIALRGSRRFVKDYEPYQLSEEKLGKFSLIHKKNYLIIGGLGNFGMELSEFIASNCQSNIFLTTRTNFPPESEWNEWIEKKGVDNSISRKMLKIKEIAEKGSCIKVLTADVSIKEKIEEFRLQIVKEYGPISGIIHAAGVVENGMIQNKTVESFNKVFAAKVQGTRNICEVFLQDNPDFILLCSSMNSIIGGLGQVDNTAANAFVDAYAEFCHVNAYINVYAINWGAVNEARTRNYATSHLFIGLSEEHVKNKMTKEEIFDVYKRLFSVHLGPRIVVSTINFNEVVANWNRVGSLKYLIKEVQISKKSRQDVIAQEFYPPETVMEQRIAKYWQDMLGIDAVGVKDNFFELGGNSLIAIQFIGKLTEVLPIKIHAMSIYEYPTLHSFAAYAEQLENEYQEKIELQR